MMKRRIFITMAVGLLCFAGGAGLSIAIHGDWLLMRSGKECVAYDPDSAALIGKWPPAPDGRCRLSALLLSRMGL